MSERIIVEVKGLDKLLKKIGAEAILGKPLRDAFKASGFELMSEARRLSPIDTGRLRGSIIPQEDPSPIPMWGKVGTNVKYAPYQEYGTGENSDFPGGGIRRRKGGIRPKRYLRGAMENKQAEVIRIFEDVPRKIEQEWGK